MLLRALTRRLLVFLASSVALLFFTFNSAFAFDEPASDTLQAIPALSGPVVDTAGTLNAAQVEQLSQKLRALRQQYGAQMQVLIIPTTQPEDAFSYSMRVVEKWQLGSKEKDDGLLLMIVINDRKAWIQTGYGLEGVIPDIVAKSLVRDTLAPFLRTGDFSGGINAVIDASFQRISGEVTAMPEPKSKKKGEQPDWMGAVIFGAIIIAVLSNVLGGFFASGLGAAGVFLFVWLFIGSSLVLALVLAIVTPLLALVFRGSGYVGGMGGGGVGGSGGGGGSWSGGGGGFGGGGAGGDW